MTGKRRVSLLSGISSGDSGRAGALPRPPPRLAVLGGREDGRFGDRSASVYARSSDRPSGDFGPRPFRCASAFRRDVSRVAGRSLRARSSTPGA